MSCDMAWGAWLTRGRQVVRSRAETAVSSSSLDNNNVMVCSVVRLFVDYVFLLYVFISVRGCISHDRRN